MARSLILAAVLACSASAPGFAAPPPAQDGHGAPSAPARATVELYNALSAQADEARSMLVDNDPSCPQKLDAPLLVSPVVREDDQSLVGYAFVTPRICLSRGNMYDHISRMHVLNDRIVRAVHRVPLVQRADGVIDRAATAAEIMSVAAEVVPADHIDRISLLGGDLRLVR